MGWETSSVEEEIPVTGRLTATRGDLGSEKAFEHALCASLLSLRRGGHDVPYTEVESGSTDAHAVQA
jgi:hypothetical protein